MISIPLGNRVLISQYNYSETSWGGKNKSILLFVQCVRLEKWDWISKPQASWLPSAATQWIGSSPSCIYNPFDKPSASCRGCSSCILFDWIRILDDSLEKLEADGSWHFSWRQLQTTQEARSVFVSPPLRSHCSRSLNFHFSQCWLRRAPRQMLLPHHF